jgi:hypothetical protein
MPDKYLRKLSLFSLNLNLIHNLNLSLLAHALAPELDHVTHFAGSRCGEKLELEPELVSHFTKIIFFISEKTGMFPFPITSILYKYIPLAVCPYIVSNSPAPSVPLRFAFVEVNSAS